MKKRYFLISLFTLGITLVGCNTTTTQKDFYNDFVMFMENQPPQKNTGSSWNPFFEIKDCLSFKDKLNLPNNMRYGTLYYINNQSIPANIHIKGTNIDETIQIPAKASQGIVWESPNDSLDHDYLLSITSDSSEMLSGYVTYGYSDSVLDIEKSKNPYCYITTVFSDFIIQKENLFHTSITLTDEQYVGSTSYTNTQDAIATINVKGNDVNQTIEVPPFTMRDIRWEKVSSGNQEYTVTIRCDEGHTLNGFLYLNRLVTIRES